MNNLRLAKSSINLTASKQFRLMCSGAGKGGGSKGERSGASGKNEAAREEEYFYNQQQKQIKKLQEHLSDEIVFHQEQVKRHQDAINRHKTRVNELDKKQ